MNALAHLTDIQATVLSYALALPRLITFFTILPVFSKKSLGGGLIRNGVALSFALFVFPLMPDSAALATKPDYWLLSLLFKEVALGLLLGYCAAIPFWAIEAAGFFIDNQRGATLASVVNPSLGTQTSPLGLLLSQAIITLFFVGGAALVCLKGLFLSYKLWPVGALLPAFTTDGVYFFLKQLDIIGYVAVLLAAPVIIGMFLSEFGLGLISRFAPQLNVFFLAMPVKSAVSQAILVVYLAILVAIAGEQLINIDLVFDKLYSVIQ
ncbi:type III secretion system export apparatus subunit SctT [Spartinivicinus poritis]|uniref:Type III secretion system export apparatus subunit SctT n=1 Tax=Spartinivicinus poritis TaxID=2994640 RepID=A0ABT5U3P1_9GAMM|nr:type III secretion system export apparatus subunit SctT [Spartinivicinus sp. A2-2]MDE1460990.1 type III secretion system export apparatus subunit SctT [Spartinivicinus sp. A2-2]